ncbi:MAG: HU family DNA-binding protein [Pseudobacteriovorax sp.]|nr:HU family DNA-binding protein [Pseudobacteriovorax sp.]
MAVKKKKAKAKTKATKKKVAKKTTAKRAKPKKKTTVKKATKKTTTRKTATKKVASSAAGKPYKASAKPVTKSQLIGALSEKHDLPKRQVADIFDTLFEEIVPAELKKHKKINLLSVVKLVEKKKPATKARKGINPFTGEEMMFKAKPASKTVRAVSLKKLKESI